MSSSFATASAVLFSISQVFCYLSFLAVYSLLNIQNDSKSKLNEHISLIILNSLCQRIINLGDFTLFIQVDSCKNQASKTTQKY